jgi:hypothetical protein
VNLKPGLLAGLGQSLDKIAAIPVVQEDRAFAVSPPQDVIDRSRILDSQWTRHAPDPALTSSHPQALLWAKLRFDPFDL